MSGEPGDRPIGAYGLRLEGVDEARALLGTALPSWHRLLIRSSVGPASTTFERVDERSAVLRLRTGGTVELDREAGEAVYTTARLLTPDELVHPFLAPAAAVMSYWLGRDALHAGAFAVDGRAWGVIAERGAGKSSTLAWLGLHETEVLTDDLLVIDAGLALPGPRSVDLRGDAAAHLEAGEPLGTIGARERWRLRLPAAAGAAPVRLVGWVALDWGPAISVTALPSAERLALLAAQAAVRLPPRRPERLLELASLPAVRLSRPRDWSSLRPASERLLEAVAS